MQQTKGAPVLPMPMCINAHSKNNNLDCISLFIVNLFLCSVCIVFSSLVMECCGAFAIQINCMIRVSKLWKYASIKLYDNYNDYDDDKTWDNARSIYTYSPWITTNFRSIVNYGIELSININTGNRQQFGTDDRKENHRHTYAQQSD